MSAFLDHFRGEQTGWAHGRPVWTTLAPLRYRSDLLQATIIVPTEFITDGASVPRWPLLWLLAGGRGNRSAVIHDFPYQFKGWWLVLDDGTWRWFDVEKPLADDVFRESLPADPMSGVGDRLAGLMLAGVRVGGRGAWTNQERASDLNPIWSGGGWETP